MIPAGAPYLTKVNGKLVMARSKQDRPAQLSINLLGDMFGVKKVARTPPKSDPELQPPLLVGGVTYVPQQQFPYPAPVPPEQFTYPTSTPQAVFPLGNPNQAQPQAFVYPPSNPSSNPSSNPPRPTEQDLQKLKDIDAHFLAGKTSVTVTRHICGNCGKLRSKNFHKENPMKLGETPTASFCGKCQRDASSTSRSSSGCRERDSGKKKKKKTRKGKSRERVS